MRKSGFGLVAIVGLLAGPAFSQDATPSSVAVEVSAFELPWSDFASPEAGEWFADHVLAPGPTFGPDIAKVREDYAVVDRSRIARLRALYDVTVERTEIGGVPVQIVTPADRAPDPGRILINLHGGGFFWGSDTGALVEAIPIAASSGMQVVTVDYRLAPEARFPAASEDVASVYASLLERFDAKSIGIYGCSAGSMLTAQSVVWFQQHELPSPGAIGLFCMGASMPGGDSVYLSQIASGGEPGNSIDWTAHPYFAGADFSDPKVVPLASPEAIAAFPPTLLISGTRDGGLSSVLATHAALNRAGVSANLHVWDGMWHSFMSDPEPEESREAYRTVGAFFRKELESDDARTGSGALETGGKR